MTTPLPLRRQQPNSQPGFRHRATGSRGKERRIARLVKTDKDDFAPRVGLAWQVLPHTVLRTATAFFQRPGTSLRRSLPALLQRTVCR